MSKRTIKIRHTIGSKVGELFQLLLLDMLRFSKSDRHRRVGNYSSSHATP